MAEHHNMFDLQDLNAIFQRCGGGMILVVWRIGRHQIGDIARDEQLARPGVEDHLWRGPAVAARDHHDVGRLPGFRQIAVSLALQRMTAIDEGLITSEQPSGQDVSHAWAPFAGRSLRLSPRQPHARLLRRCDRQCNRVGFFARLKNAPGAPPTHLAR
jgi:hypothetical protein